MEEEKGYSFNSNDNPTKIMEIKKSAVGESKKYPEKKVFGFFECFRKKIEGENKDESHYCIYFGKLRKKNMKWRDGKK